MAFKKHMLLFSDEDSFRTLCGIDDGCSEAFYERLGHNVVSFGKDQKTTCKKCLQVFKKMISMSASEQEKFTSEKIQKK